MEHATDRNRWREGSLDHQYALVEKFSSTRPELLPRICKGIKKFEDTTPYAHHFLQRNLPVCTILHRYASSELTGLDLVVYYRIDVLQDI